MHQVFLNFQNHLKKNYSDVPTEVLDRITPQLISPFTIKIPGEAFEKAQNIVSDIYKLSQQHSYQEKILKNFPFKTFQKTPSLLSSLDVHLTKTGNLKIIEINTNASSFLINTENYLSRGLSLFSNAKKNLIQSFTKAFGDKLAPGSLIIVLDETPEQQNLYAEFLMFKSFLQKEFSVECKIADPKDLSMSSGGELLLGSKKISAIYNRYCDFYLTTPDTLTQAYQKNETLISPNPWGYALSADKNRLVDWSGDCPFPHLQSALLKTKHFSDFKNADEIWSERGKYFFKPPNAYGGKSVYKGKSISRVVFQRIYDEKYLAQEAAPAPEVTLHYDRQDYTFKYDLRFYFFEGEIHLAVARLYQGQVTNLQTLYGGLTPLEII